MGLKDEKTGPSSSLASSQPADAIYEIRVKGCLDPADWSDWFGDLQILPDPNLGETQLCGPITDQAALYGLLSRLRDRGLTLISVHQTHPRA